MIVVVAVQEPAADPREKREGCPRACYWYSGADASATGDDAATVREWAGERDVGKRSVGLLLLRQRRCEASR